MLTLLRYTYTTESKPPLNPVHLTGAPTYSPAQAESLGARCTTASLFHTILPGRMPQPAVPLTLSPIDHAPQPYSPSHTESPGAMCPNLLSLSHRVPEARHPNLLSLSH